MACCNSKRAALTANTRSSTPPPAPPAAVLSSTPTHVVFVYTGSGLRSVKGTATGKIYQFAGCGTKVTVDYSDAAAMMAEVGLSVVPEK
jgi:hypothetical protein